MLFTGLARLSPLVGSFQPTSTAIDPFSMTLSTLHNRQVSMTRGKSLAASPSVARHISISFDRLRSQSILFR
ncbi:hypothetical protein V8C86DRAFT_2845761 [Haematococcus lacustris]